jgi:hypothetical protein
MIALRMTKKWTTQCAVRGPRTAFIYRRGSPAARVIKTTASAVKTRKAPHALLSPTSGVRLGKVQSSVKEP